jgi:threonine/homoserine/homoserine lactone efflux protein
MVDATSLALFMTATLALNLAPGPDMLYVSTRSLSQGRRAGVISALGIAAGAVVHTLAIASGLAALLRAVPIAYEIVQYAGAAYLIWLGIKALRSRSGPLTGAPLDRASEWAVFRQGMITNLLNPKVALFFLAFLPQFTNPTAGSVAAQIVVLGCLFNLSGTLVNIGVAWLAASARQWLTAGHQGKRALRWLTGSVFIGLGLRLALGERR